MSGCAHTIEFPRKNRLEDYYRAIRVVITATISVVLKRFGALLSPCYIKERLLEGVSSCHR
jgi:hypothetical protein